MLWLAGLVAITALFLFLSFHDRVFVAAVAFWRGDAGGRSIGSSVAIRVPIDRGAICLDRASFFVLGPTSLSLVLVLLILIVLVIAPDVTLHVRGSRAIGDFEDEEEPEEVDGLQDGQQAEGYVLRDPAFVLLGDPV